MQIVVDGVKHEIPFSIKDIKLSEFIDYYNQFGLANDAQAKIIIDKKYPDSDYGEFLKAIDIDNHLDEEAISWYCFWAKLDIEKAKESPGFYILIENYRILKSILIAEESNTEKFPNDIIWKGEVWSIQNYVVNSASKMSFNEVVTSKEIIRQIASMDLSKWHAFPYLCAVFFRKKEELFTDDLVHEGSERIKLMMDLPMNIVLQVGFFLSFCVNTWKRTSQYLTEADQATLSRS